MRVLVIAMGLGGVALAGVPGAASAQAGKAPATRNTPEGIVCAMTGSCGGDAAPGGDARMSVGNEKAFSLARSSGRSADAAAPVAHPAALTRRGAPHDASARGMGMRARVAPAPLASDGGLDMQLTFGLGSADLSPRAKAEAKAFATAMAAPQMAGRQFAIEGHTDSSGSRQKNVDLSQRRAQAVVDYLVGQGVDPGRLSAKGYGPDRPLPGKPGSAPANRRVEFVKG